jgi:DNA-binding XRE family transcriptional regulator
MALKSFPCNWLFYWDYICRPFWDQCNSRRGIHDEHNDNICPLVYTLEIEVNMLDFNPKYPKNPQNLGERIRKARMDKGLMIKELATQIGVTEDTVINWEIRDIKPKLTNLRIIEEHLGVK